MIVIFTFMLFLFLPAGVSGQLLPGLDEDRISSYMADRYREFVRRDPPNIEELDFIKYEHLSGDKTLIVFFSDNGVCSYTRMIVDAGYASDYEALYSGSYETEGEDRWMARERNEDFIISMDRADWYFTITVRLRKNIGE